MHETPAVWIHVAVEQVGHGYLRIFRSFAMYRFAAALPFTNRAARPFFLEVDPVEDLPLMVRLREVDFRFADGAERRFREDDELRAARAPPFNRRRSVCIAGVCWFIPCCMIAMVNLHRCGPPASRVESVHCGTAFA